MTTPTVTRMPDGSTAIEGDLADVSEWNPTVPQFRDVVFGYGISGGAPFADALKIGGARRMLPTEREISACADMAADAVKAGRVIDFGYVDNAVIIDTAKRAGPLYVNGMIGLPFIEPWVFCHGWDRGTAFYLVNPLGDDHVGGDLEIIDLVPIQMQTLRTMMMGDRALLQCGKATEDNRWSHYPANVLPSTWRALAMEVGGSSFLEQARQAAGNVLDPLMTALMILSTNGVRRERIEPDAKLQRARIKRGKPPLPSYDRIDGSAYVTAIRARLDGLSQRYGQPGGGHHASPVAHLRRGHVRTYADGKRTFIRDTLVNVTDEARAAFMSNRTHYEVKR